MFGLILTVAVVGQNLSAQERGSMGAYSNWARSQNANSNAMQEKAMIILRQLKQKWQLEPDATPEQLQIAREYTVSYQVALKKASKLRGKRRQDAVQKAHRDVVAAVCSRHDKLTEKQLETAVAAFDKQAEKGRVLGAAMNTPPAQIEAAVQRYIALTGKPFQPTR